MATPRERPCEQEPLAHTIQGCPLRLKSNVKELLRPCDWDIGQVLYSMTQG